MLRTSESETEILLGNKQLMGIFFVVAALLGIAFYGGYMVGRNGPAAQAKVTNPAPESAQTVAPPAGSQASKTSSAGGETHSFPADSGTLPNSGSQSHDANVQPADQTGEEPPLGTPKRKAAQLTGSTTATVPVSDTSGAFAPQQGQEFLQVAAVGKDEAEAVSDVLQKKGFQAHAVPKPGNAKIYRVLIGPLRDAADLSSTRDALRRTGFREVITQKY